MSLLGATFGGDPVPLDRERGHEFLHVPGLHQVGAQRVDHQGLQRGGAFNARRVAADALLPCRRTGEVVFADRGHGAAAGGAEHLAGQDVLRAPVLPEFGAVGIVGPGGLAHVGEARVHAAPQILIDDPQMRHILGHPLLGRVQF